MTRQDKLTVASPLRMASVRLEATVDVNTGYKNGRLNGLIDVGRTPEPGTKMSVVIAVAGEKAARAGVAGEKTAMPTRKTFPVTDTLVSFTLPVANLRLWSAETPVLYEVKLRLTDSGGHVLDSLSLQAAFRTMDVRGGALYSNGRAVPIKGMRQEKYDTAVIRRAKLHNINALRAMPGDDGTWRKLCDQYGLYIIDNDGINYTVCGLGGFKERWDTIRAHPEAEGNQGSFVPWLFAQDGQALPMAAEVKQVYQPVLTTTAFTKNIPGVGVKVYNDYAFRDLSHLTMEWQLLVNGVAGRRGTVVLPAVGPQKTAFINIPVTVPAGEALLNIYYKQKKAEPMIPAGFIVAAEQLNVSSPVAPIYNDVSVHPAGELVFKDEGGSFGITSTVANLDMQFNKQTGWLQHFTVSGRSLLDDTLGLVAGFWQSPWCDSGKNMTAWTNAGRDARLQLFSTSTSNDFVIVRADYVLPETGTILHVHYTVNAKGEMQVEDILEVDTAMQTGADTSVRQTKPSLPRMGMQWSFPPGYDSIIYYGRGPQENYADRKAAAFAGVYRQTMADQRPRTDVRWWKVTDRQGHGLQITADSALLMMNAAGGAPARLHIDHRQMDLSGRGLPYGNYHYIYKVTPL